MDGNAKLRNGVVWRDLLSHELMPLSQSMQLWLSQIERLTQTLSETFNQWSLDLLYHGKVMPTSDEKKLLNCEGDCFGRVILHKNAMKPLVLGRVIVPQKTYEKFSVELDAIGASSIGEKFLFGQKNISRSPFKYALLSVTNERILKWLPEDDLSLKFAYARTSIFTLEGKYPLMVSEFFLNELPLPLVVG